MPLVRVTVVLGAVGLAAFATFEALPAPANDDLGAPIFAFSKQTVASQLNIERRIKGHASTVSIQADHRYLTDEPHVAGSPRDRALAGGRTALEASAGPLPHSQASGIRAVSGISQ